MKIIEVCTAHSLGGLELYFSTCCRKLHQRGHRVIAVVLTDSKLHRMLVGKVECIPVNSRFYHTFFKLRALMKYFEPDILHVHHKKDLRLGAFLKWFSGVNYKYVHTRQMDLPGGKKNLYHRLVYGSIDLLIAITDRLKNQIISRIAVDPQKVVRLYYGVSETQSNPDRYAEISLDPDKFNIGVIARIDRKKEQHLIMGALSMLKSKKIDVIAHLIGGSTDDQYLNKLQILRRKNQLEDCVLLHGFVTNPQEILAGFDVVVLTTSNETFGLVLPEAMRAGIAVIGSNGGGVPEIIDHGETGLLFDPGNVVSLADQLEKMMNENVRKKLSIQGKKKADAQFEIDQHFAKLERLLIN